MSKRTRIDFSKHEHRREIFKSEDGNEIIVDHLQIGRNHCGYFKFTNSNNHLSVTGDYGNWIFCRPFIPHPEDTAEVYYWTEKLEIHSIQKPMSFDSDKTTIEINELIETGLEDYGYEGDDLEEAKEWFTELLEYVDEEREYINQAYYSGTMPSFLESELIPHSEVVNPRLNYIFDAFEEICDRLGKVIPEIKIDPTTRTVEMKLVETNVEIIIHEPIVDSITISKQIECDIINDLNPMI